jgi:hypothetical protein
MASRDRRRRARDVLAVRPRHAEGTARGVADVDLDAHTLRFVDMHDIGDMLVHSGWSTP